MEFAKRIQFLSRNVFADMDRAKTAARGTGKDIIDLSLGSSDLPTAAPTIKAIEESLQDTSTHGYLLHNGTKEFRETAARWYGERFNITVDAETEVLALIGSQEGTAHLPLAILNPGDFALLLDPGYPSHVGGVYLAGGQVYAMPLLVENQFLPVFSDIPEAVLKQAKMMVLSYPHNPTTAIATLEFFTDAVNFCRQHNLVLVHDFPYVDIVFAGTAKPPSVLQADKNKEVSIEFFTMSKSYNMGGFRVGFAVGNSELITALRKIKAVVDFNQYLGILNGAIAALTSPQEFVTETVNIFQQRRDALVQALNNIGWQVNTPNATMYLWAKLPKQWEHNSVEFCTKLVAETGVALAPGAGFGKAGEGYVRFALVKEPIILEKAAQEISVFLHNK
jgi:aspartate/methionine/tyrosine aminotransferase